MKTDIELSSCMDCAAYIPCYNDGNAVMAVRKDGQTVIIYRSIKSLLKNILKVYNIDIHSLRKNYSNTISRKNLIPIPLGLNSVLIPVKVRKTIGVNDGSYGYVDLSSIADVSEDGNTVIHLTCGNDVHCLETQKTIAQRMRKGRLVGERNASQILRMNNLEHGVSYVYSEYSGTATKEDMAMLIYEIMQLKKEIKRNNSNYKSGGEQNVHGLD